MRARPPAGEFAELGLGILPGVILKLLLDQDGMTQRELTRKLQITSSSCGAHLAKLEREGYLERQASPQDKRTFDLSLTASGRDLGRAYQEASAVVLEDWASGLTQPEKAQLHHLLTKLHAGLERRLGLID
jgi:DNA-binding MarR family transcriptional regulator